MVQKDSIQVMTNIIALLLIILGLTDTQYMCHQRFSCSLFILPFMLLTNKLVSYWYFGVCGSLLEGHHVSKHNFTSLPIIIHISINSFQACSQNCGKQQLASPCLLSLCPSACNNLAPTGQIFMKFDI